MGASDSPDVRTNGAVDETLAGVLERLRALAEGAGITVRIEPFELQMTGKGGLCKIHSRPVILVDARLTALEQIGVIGQALGRALPRGTRVPGDLAPYLRTGHGKVARLARLRPLVRVR